MSHGFTDAPLAEALAALVGAENVLTDEAIRAGVSSNWYPVATKRKQAGGDDPSRLLRAVVTPGSAEEVSAVVRWANETRTPLIPVGGVSNTVGSTEPERPSVAVDLKRLQHLSWDEDSLLVRAGAGLGLGALEERLNQHGYTLGVVPQSLHLATVGGSVAANAVGLLSGRYGRLADRTAALEVVLPTGEIVRTHPALGASAGPDLARLFVGSEGALGIVTEATLRMAPLPDVRAWAAFTFADFAAGLDAARLVLRTDARPALLRLFDGDAAEDLLTRSGLPAGEALLLLAFEGDELPQTGQYQMAHAVCQKAGGTERPGDIGEAWWEERFQTGWMAPNARASGLADVLAVSAPWSKLPAVYDAMRRAVSPLVTQLHGHVGHAYPTGAALDITFQAQAEPATPDAAIDLHRRILAAGLNACADAGGSVAHHYGVGVAKRDFLAREHGETGLLLLRRLKAALDPNDILNPGKLGAEP